VLPIGIQPEPLLLIMWHRICLYYHSILGVNSDDDILKKRVSADYNQTAKVLFKQIRLYMISSLKRLSILFYVEKCGDEAVVYYKSRDSGVSCPRY
jgi:hypothetical protein